MGLLVYILIFSARSARGREGEWWDRGAKPPSPRYTDLRSALHARDAMPVTTMLLPSPRREKSEEYGATSTNACSSISITTVSQGDDDSDQHYRKESD